LGFHKNVFVNCPFDDDYRPLLFTISYLGFKPRIALEELDSGAPRIGKIVDLIRSSRYAIHDLSRLQARKRGEFYRLNMPLELGMDVGCRLFGRTPHTLKRFLILEEQRYRYRAAVSDLAGSDIAVHGGSPETLVTEVRNWLSSIASLQAPGPARVWTAFLEFMSENYDDLTAQGFSDRDIEALPIDELLRCLSSTMGETNSARVNGVELDQAARTDGCDTLACCAILGGSRANRNRSPDLYAGSALHKSLTSGRRLGRNPLQCCSPQSDGRCSHVTWRPSRMPDAGRLRYPNV
jgi:hypothetical protein